MATRLKTVEQALDELPQGLALLRQPFPDHQVHLDYVGHAALTDRLLDTDPNLVVGAGWVHSGGLASARPQRRLVDQAHRLRRHSLRLRRCGRQERRRCHEGDDRRRAPQRRHALRCRAGPLAQGRSPRRGRRQARPAQATRQERIAEHKNDPFPQGPARTNRA
jgi:hypothetical protein